MYRSLALLLAVISLPYAAHAQFKLPTGYDFTKLPPMGDGKPLNPPPRVPGVPLRIYEVPPDVRAFIGKEETCANYILNRRDFKDNPEVMKVLDNSFNTIECNQLPCERNQIIEKYRNDREILQFIYSYTDTEVPNWTGGGTGTYYSENLCKVPLDPNAPPPMNPYSPDFIKRKTAQENPEKVDPEMDITAEQLNEVLNRIEKISPDQINDQIVTKIVEDVKAGRETKIPTGDEPAPAVPQPTPGGAATPPAAAPAPAQ